MVHTLYNINALNVREVVQEKVELLVTSPPYWNLKDYGVIEQIGYGQEYTDYINNLTNILQKSIDVLHDGCKMCINIGDVYDNSLGVYKIYSPHADIIRLLTQTNSVDYLGSIIWNKITTTNTSGGCSWMGSIYYPRDGYITYEHEYIAIFKKKGKYPYKKTKEVKELSKLTKEERSRWFRGVWDDIRPSRQKTHPATYPIELPKRLIKMFSFYNETVLDPFCGSGSTTYAAIETDRNSIGFEINKDYLDNFVGNIQFNEQEKKYQFTS